MYEGIHTCGSAKACWHRRRHIRIHDGNDWNVMRINTNEFAVLFNIRNNIVNSNLCCRTRCCCNSDDWQARILSRRQAFKAAYIGELRVRNNGSNRFTCIDWTTATNGNDNIGTSRLTSLNTSRYIFDGRIWFDTIVDFIIDACRIK